jgi:hypothetical protein
VERNAAGVIFIVAESTGDIVITDQDNKERVRNPQIPDPSQQKKEGKGEFEAGFMRDIDPIVDGEGPVLGTKGAMA